MPQRGRRHADQILSVSLAFGATVAAAARAAGVGEATVYRRLKDPEFCKMVEQAKTDMVQRTSGAITGAGMEAVKTMAELMKPSNPPSIRLGASRSILEIGMKVREREDLEQRLAALEQQAEMNNPR
jgi:hypothetical protein